MDAKLIVGNWKMNPPTLADGKRIIEAAKRSLGTARTVQLVVAPPAVFLRELAKGQRSKRIQFAAQNIHWEQGGSFTGDISAKQVADAGAAYVLVGHAERRARGETNEDVRRKVAAALAQGLKPILCIGEDTRDDDGQYLRVLAEQLLVGVRDVPKGGFKDLIVAYEPVWAIGATKPMHAEEMHGMAIYIRKVLGGAYGRAGISVPILYGGSVDDTTARTMLREGDVDGLLVGRASSDARRFAKLIDAVRLRT